MPILDNSSILPLIITAGFLDGFSPCVIAILIFFIAFLLNMRESFKNIFSLGLVYIFVIFLTYLGIGVGLFSGMMAFGRHHFFAEFGSWFLILWGIVEIKDYFFPHLPFHIGMPKSFGKKAKVPERIVKVVKPKKEPVKEPVEETPPAEETNQE